MVREDAGLDQDGAVGTRENGFRVHAAGRADGLYQMWEGRKGSQVKRKTTTRHPPCSPQTTKGPLCTPHPSSGHLFPRVFIERPVHARLCTRH